jgi:multicomponent Na+:H+ antiporter subunit D
LTTKARCRTSRTQVTPTRPWSGRLWCRSRIRTLLGVLVLRLGDWPAPFGITLMLDGLSALMLLFTAILGVACVVYSIGTLDARASMNYYPLVLFLLLGVNGAFLSGDLFNLYVFFEVMLMASFALLTLGGQIGQINGGIRYVLLNLLSSSFFLMWLRMAR